MRSPPDAPSTTFDNNSPDPPQWSNSGIKQNKQALELILYRLRLFPNITPEVGLVCPPAPSYSTPMAGKPASPRLAYRFFAPIRISVLGKKRLDRAAPIGGDSGNRPSPTVGYRRSARAAHRAAARNGHVAASAITEPQGYRARRRGKERKGGDLRGQSACTPR